MSAADPKTYLWDRIGDLMGCKDPTLDKVVERTNVSRGTAQRIRESKTSIGTDVLLTLADAFGMEVSDLLTQGKAPAHAPAPEPAISMEGSLRALAADLVGMDEAKRLSVTAKLHALLDAPDSKIALATAITAITSPGEIVHEAADQHRRQSKAA